MREAKTKEKYERDIKRAGHKESCDYKRVQWKMWKYKRDKFFKNNVEK